MEAFNFPHTLYFRLSGFSRPEIRQRSSRLPWYSPPWILLYGSGMISNFKLKGGKWTHCIHLCGAHLWILNWFSWPQQEGIDALEEVIYHIETYDVTTIRASTPMFLMSRKIKSLGVKMVISGEGSDEIFGGYLYFHKAPNKEEFHQETCRKVSLKQFLIRSLRRSGSSYIVHDKLVTSVYSYTCSHFWWILDVLSD